MSKKVPLPGNALREVRVDVKQQQTEYGSRKAKYDGTMSEQRHDFVYVNPAYVGSTHSVNERPPEPPTSVIREQYWACSRWPYGQKLLAGAVGILVGTVIGLVVLITLKNTDSDNVIGGIF